MTEDERRRLRHQRRAVALVVRRRPVRGGPRLLRRGRAPHRHRRDAPGVPVPGRRRAAVGAHGPDPRRGPASGPCSATAWSGGWRPASDPAAVAVELTALARRCRSASAARPGYAALIEQHHAVVRPLLDQMLGARPRGRSGSSSRRPGSCSLIACATWRTCSWCGPRGGSATSPCAARSAPRARSSCGSRWRRRWWPRCWAAALAVVLAALEPARHRCTPRRPASRAWPRSRSPAARCSSPCWRRVLSGVGLRESLPALRAASPDLARLREGGRGSTRAPALRARRAGRRRRPRWRSCC